MSNELKVGDRVKVVGMAEDILKLEKTLDPTGLVGTITYFDPDYEEAPFGVVLDEEEPDGATDAYVSGDTYPELYRADELELVEDAD